jgi:hypothetical protein
VAKAREAGLIPPTGAPDADYAAALGRLDELTQPGRTSMSLDEMDAFLGYSPRGGKEQ